jgi:N-acetylmuramoyl-L-alanine amidase
LRLSTIVCLCLTPLISFQVAKAQERETVAAVLVQEAGVDGYAGMSAVAEVVLTRSRERHLTPVEVVTQRVRGVYQFSSLNGRSVAATIRAAKRSPRWQDALSIADRIYLEPGSFHNVTHGANHFTVKTEKPFWAKGRRPVAIVRHHAFYKL